MMKLAITMLTVCFTGSVVLAEETSEASGTSKLILDAPSATNVNYRAVETETVTVYESRMFPGFRSCRPEDYRKVDHSPIACQDDDVARMLSTRDPNAQRNNLVIRDNVQPSGNIYRLRFERFKRKKQE